jgi:hypothetical protein
MAWASAARAPARRSADLAEVQRRPFVPLGVVNSGLREGALGEALALEAA